jgi:hypothetical protein
VTRGTLKAILATVQEQQQFSAKPAVMIYIPVIKGNFNHMLHLCQQKKKVA